MEVDVRPGKYVVAVSGGVDSVVLLDLLSKQPDMDIVVAHFDHGIRDKSDEDRKFVAELSKRYRLHFEYAKGNLGADCSEEAARTKRYEFLNQVKSTTGASAVIAAHHQDDVLETMIINLLRGTDRRGLSSLTSSTSILRPLLHYSKTDIISYAKQHDLSWREDETNQNTKYFRNQVRHLIIPKLSRQQCSEMLRINENMKAVNMEIDQIIAKLLQNYTREINRSWFLMLPFPVAKEVAAAILRKENQELSRNSLLRFVNTIKTLPINKEYEVSGSMSLHSKQDKVIITRR